MDGCQASLVRESIPRRTSSVAFNPSRVHNMPSEYKNNIEEHDQGSEKKIKEVTKKRLADYNSQGQRCCPALTSNVELRWRSIKWKRNEERRLLEGNRVVN